MNIVLLKVIAIFGVVTTTTNIWISMVESASSAAEERSCFPAIFSFGSSVADTGTDVLTRTNSNADSLPYGMTYFKASSKRWSDGRLLIDFWAQVLRLPFLQPSIKVVGSSFLQGANFAAAGATAANSTGGANSPFYLAVQLHQFIKFRRAVVAETQPDLQLTSTNPQICTVPLPLESYFRDALYVIDSGGNDILAWFITKLPYDEMEKRIPEVSAAILHVVEGLYKEGARNILVQDVYPVGCLAKALTVYVLNYGEQARPDSSGCSPFLNSVTQLHNAFLKREIAALAEKRPDLSIAFVDTYTTRFDMMTNPSKYGFTEGIRPCCGIGGGYNYDPKRSCATSYTADGEHIQVQACANVSKHVVWDGVHFTERANQILMNALLSGLYFHPSFQITNDSCTLAEI
ncbi:hypothetical protein Mapa_016604 [Marchantia paleacea]|nr:hypothetical protein Mapa_016604 [Marchantia paleacea]